MAILQLFSNFFIIVIIVGIETAKILPTLPKLSLYDVDPQYGTFTLKLDGEVWFENSPIWVRADHTIYSTVPKTGEKKLLADSSSPQHSHGHDEHWGDYDETSLLWRVGADSKLFISSIRMYSDMVIFAQNFSGGLNNTGKSDQQNGVMSAFPSFRPATYNNEEEQEPSSLPRRWMAYNGWDCKEGHGCVSSQKQRVALGIWENATSVLPQGLEGSGPICISSSNGTKSVVISAASSFMSASQQHILDAGSKPLPPSTHFNVTANAYCKDHSGDIFDKMNISLETCRQKCLEVHCNCFDYNPEEQPSPYYNCRVLKPSLTGVPSTVPSGRNYTAYTRIGKSAGGVLSYGVMGTVANIPIGFVVEFVMVIGVGPNHAVRRWGSKLTKRYGKTNPEGKDFTAANLGYDTDAGAYYYYHPESGKSYEQTLLDVHAYAVKEKIPFQHVQIDSWWYVRGKGKGTKIWNPGPNTFPHGLSSFANKTGWRITAHNRFWSSDNAYRNNFTWIVDGDMAFPVDQAFWEWLMGYGKSWGLYVYEQDWMFTEFIGLKQVLASTTLAREWLLQMGIAAENHGIVIQYCMLWPRMALMSLEIPSVTTARASTDYHAGKNEQWILGMSSLFLDSLELRPTKDNFFSTDHQGDGSQGTERYSRLHGLISTLTNGPIFPSDAINCSDPALILRACMSDGTLLRPERAATNIDSNILDKALARGTGLKEPGEIETTTSTVNEMTYIQLLAVRTQPYTMTSQELLSTLQYYRRDANSNSKYIAFEANATANPQIFDDDHPIQLPVTNKWSFHYWTIVPVLSNGWSLMGEANTKWISVSTQRFENIHVTPSNVSVLISGVPGEVVSVMFLPPSSMSPITVHCTIPIDFSVIHNADGKKKHTKMLITMPQEKCHPTK